MIVSLIQAPLVWESPSENRLYFEQKIKAISQHTDLIVLPEMFSTGFTMNPKQVAETMQGVTISWLIEIAKAKNTAITGSLVIQEEEQFFNRMVFVFPSGKLEYYDKRHLFTLAGEEKVYQPGKEKKIIEYKNWKICLQVCYDLRFPVFARNIENYDLLIYVANWPKVRINTWDILLKARAVENLSYVIGLNRIGLDDNEHEYIGHSQVIDELGNYLLEPQRDEHVFHLELDKEKMLETRKKLNFLNDRDEFSISY
ncbi:amidohydrolase [Flavobacterium piscinae]|uniref:Omega-amidase YafV n=1 Tax=Flavobacterium piscinae TaxID=2506424 RepID=A0A4Q1KXF7_9FLAO|nr:amidohydrolase [Flavobacterium piscinae]RXR34179.1 amidohydrolase [Flavobacterium piscinae]